MRTQSQRAIASIPMAMRVCFILPGDDQNLFL
jgi:hypothetical protein